MSQMIHNQKSRKIRFYEVHKRVSHLCDLNDNTKDKSDSTHLILSF